MFVDSVDIFIKSGDGGAGAVSFHREKFIIQGGPDGGDGGKGGDIYFEVDVNNDTLSNFRGKKHYKAQNGAQGESRNKSGKKGSDLCLKIPLGTQIIDFESGEILYDFIKKEKILFLRGGKGGLGNARFKNAINQKPVYAQSGIKGESRHLRLELKIIADVGLVGFPNVGKSMLLSVISNAKPQIADYEFTTLIPNLGVVEMGLDSFVVADIPGIIDGASLGLGLGLAFLKHIERTNVFLFVLDSTRDSLLAQFLALQNEIKKFNTGLLNRSFGIVISKCDLGSDIDLGEICAYFDSLAKKPRFILPISSINKLNIKELKNYLLKAVYEK